MNRQHLEAYLALLLTMVIWGLAAVFMRKTALELTPNVSIALRYAVLTIILVPALALIGGWRIAKEHWPRLLIAGLAGMAAFNWLVNEGFSRVPAGIGSIITMVEPFFIAALAWAWLGERLNRLIIAGIAVSLIGSIVLFWPDIMAESAEPVSGWGVACLVLSCAAWAVYTVAAKPLLEIYSSFTITAWTMLLTAPVMFAVAGSDIFPAAQKLDMSQALEILFLAIGSGLLGTVLWNRGVRHVSGAVAGSFLYLIPVVAVLAGWMILGEAITPNLLLGGAIILAGVAIAQFGPSVTGSRLADAS